MTSCPDELALAKAISTGGDPEITAHVATCAPCRATWDGTRRAIELARQRATPMPTAAQREEMRTAILAAQLSDAPRAVARRPRHAAWIGASALAVAIAIVLFARSSGPARGHVHASVRPHPAASYTAATTSPDEIVMLHDGSIDVDVAPLHAGERFRVILADAEIEVHGTAFVATARAGRLVGVTVRHGIVEVRSATAPPQRLVAGESWAAPAAVAPPIITASVPLEPVVADRREPAPLPHIAPDREPAPSPPSRIAPDRAPAPSPPRIAPDREPAPSPPRIASRRAAAPDDLAPAPDLVAPTPPQSPPAARKLHEVAYDEAWDAMRAGLFARAAVAFARVQILDPDGPLAEDAGLWHAIALERGGRSAEAATAFRDFLATFPASRRAGEASAMLGWILVATNQPAEAARRFRAAIGDPTPAVRDSAKAGLEAVAKMR